MNIKQTELPGLLVIEQKVFSDNRGYFFELYNTERHIGQGVNKNFVQDNISRSYKNVVRGLHYQVGRQQAKLVSVLHGTVFDVAVDIRRNSPTFGQWFGQILSDENHLQMFIPEGFAHGFCVMSDYADFFYKCTDYYSPENERSIRWNDDYLKIDWPTREAITSAKDSVSPLFHQIKPDDLPIYR